MELIGTLQKKVRLTGLLSNQGEKSINLYFIMVLLRKKYKSMVLQSTESIPTRFGVLEGSSRVTYTSQGL